MRAVLLDSSVYIAALRSGNEKALSWRRSFEASLWLSSVVLEELYAGSTSRDQFVIERVERDFDRVGRILVPTLNDWILTGKVLARLAHKYDYELVGRSRMTNDALIAMSAACKGIVVLTANPRDFARLAEFRPFRWQTWSG